MPNRPYTYFDFTQSICAVCLERADAKILFEEGSVYMLKRCGQHGIEKVLISEDIEYYLKMRTYVKKSEMPYSFATKTQFGCPYDCGLCEDHEQHSCLSIVEITDQCNLACPTCYASSAPGKGTHRSFEEVKGMFDMIVAREGHPDVVQISGGEPTIHPDFFKIVEYARTLPIRHLMVNTNGIRIATDDAFVEELSKYKKGFEIYLQFDSLDVAPLEHLRGADLRKIREKALEALNRIAVSTTLVVTVQKGINDHEMGAIIDYALTQPSVRGVTFQPVQMAGRFTNVEVSNKIPLSTIRTNILSQTSVFSPDDIIPVPCNPDALAMGYALKMEDKVVPLTRYVDPKVLLEGSRNTIVYEQDEKMKQHILQIFSTGTAPETVGEKLKELLCCLPKIVAPSFRYDQLFRVIIMSFMDAHDFDVRAVKKSCVHIATTDGKLIPFETMNIFYRDNQEVLQKIRRKIAHGSM